MANEAYPFTSFNFHVQLNVMNASALGLSSPLCSMEFQELDGLEMSIEPKTVHEGGNNTQVVTLVGRTSYGNLTLKRGMTRNLDLWKWFTAAIGNENRGLKASGVVLVKDAAGKKTVLRYELHGCLPIKIKAPSFNAKEGGIAIEELQMAVSYFTISAP